MREIIPLDLSLFLSVTMSTPEIIVRKFESSGHQTDLPEQTAPDINDVLLAFHQTEVIYSFQDAASTSLRSLHHHAAPHTRCIRYRALNSMISPILNKQCSTRMARERVDGDAVLKGGEQRRRTQDRCKVVQ